MVAAVDGTRNWDHGVIMEDLALPCLTTVGMCDLYGTKWWLSTGKTSAKIVVGPKHGLINPIYFVDHRFQVYRISSYFFNDVGCFDTCCDFFFFLKNCCFSVSQNSHILPIKWINTNQYLWNNTKLGYPQWLGSKYSNFPKPRWHPGYPGPHGENTGPSSISSMPVSLLDLPFFKTLQATFHPQQRIYVPLVLMIYDDS